MALVAVLFVAGCGGGGGGGGTSGGQSSALASKPANVVVRDAANAVKSASSFHMSGQVKGGSNSSFLGQKSLGIDLTVVKGKGATGSMTLAGANVDILVTDNNGYLRAGSAFWKVVAAKEGSGQAGGMIAQLFADKWIKFPASNKSFGALTDPANPNSLFKSLTSSHGKLENKGDTTYKGQSVVAIQDTTKGGTLYVASTGTPYPVALTKVGGKQSGSITFDNWNQPVTLTVPKGALDLSQFGG